MPEQNDVMYISQDKVKELASRKLQQAGLTEKHADIVADHLAYADGLGVHSHGTVRVEYYAERIAKGGTTIHPNITFEQTGPSTGVMDGDNAAGFVVALDGLEKGIEMAKETGLSMIGIKRVGHCGTLSYYLRRAAEEGMVTIAMAQSDPMVVPFGGADPFFGTNPIGFGAPKADGIPIIIDMATTVQAWGKVLDARARNNRIPETWAVDEHGNPTTDPFKVNALVPAAGPKGYGLMMMVDILCGSLLGLPYGKNVSSMYTDLDKGRDLGQIFIVINPEYFGNGAYFQEALQNMANDLHAMTPAPGFVQVKFPGEDSREVVEKYKAEGIPIVKEIYDYLISDDIHYDNFENGAGFNSK